jgi:hypothetical protein
MTAAARMPSGGPADADDGVQLGPAQADRDGGGEVPLGPDVDARSGLPDLLDEVLVRGPCPKRRRLSPRACAPPPPLWPAMFSATGASMSICPWPADRRSACSCTCRGSEHGPLRGGRDRRDRPLLALDQKLETLDGSTARSTSGPPAPKASPTPRIPGRVLSDRTQPLSSGAVRAGSPPSPPRRPSRARSEASVASV